MFLALDTATERASVALGIPGSAPLELNIEGARRHAAALLPAVQSLLQRAGATLDDLRGIALSDGPGSFTGLRVGAAVAKALVHSRSLPLWTAPSLLVRAAEVAQGSELVLAIANALRGDVYSAAYRFLPDGIQAELIPAVRHPDELVNSSLRPAAIVGEAPAEIIAILERWVGKQVIGPPRCFPRAARLLDLIGQRGGAREVKAVREWEPVYGRPAEAQARWESAHGRPLSDSLGRRG
jgi:tRNA threonylcarbamoyladenosine biosynthesis protein TsaB